MHRGSLQYWQHRRARERLPRMRSAPKHLKEPQLCNVVAYKVGMAHLTMIDDSEAPSKNTEISRPVTILELPEMEVYGIRLYRKQQGTGYKTASTEILSKQFAKRVNAEKITNDEGKIDSFKQKLNEYSNITALVAAYPKGMPVEQHHPARFEAALGGNTTEEKFNFAAGLLGKKVSASEIFKPGEYIDVISVSKGKGWQGPIKRFGVARLLHKATQKTRHVGTLGPFTPGKVLFTVPQAGQLGFNYRTEHNKRILKIGSKADASKINPKSGFINYGNIQNDHILIDGSVPGPAKRLVRIRKSIRNRNLKGVKEPKITQIMIN
ncbi:MAG: 50S ribosomal protein L3 [Candidatus Micrarchaeota archaeon]|nr:50S ribosomal protein L3 [Candidatus Micrarchaeota archaeon]